MEIPECFGISRFGFMLDVWVGLFMSDRSWSREGGSKALNTRRLPASPGPAAAGASKRKPCRMSCDSSICEPGLPYSWRKRQRPGVRVGKTAPPLLKVTSQGHETALQARGSFSSFSSGNSTRKRVDEEVRIHSYFRAIWLFFFSCTQPKGHQHCQQLTLHADLFARKPNYHKQSPLVSDRLTAGQRSEKRKKQMFLRH